MSLQISPRWKRFAAIPGVEPLREERHPLQVPVEVCGFNIRGRFFTERSETSNVSDRGCKFCLRTQIAPDAIVALRVVTGRKRGEPESSAVLFQVVRVKPDSNHWVVGAVKLQPDELWPTIPADSGGASRTLV